MYMSTIPNVMPFVQTTAHAIMKPANMLYKYSKVIYHSSQHAAVVQVAGSLNQRQILMWMSIAQMTPTVMRVTVTELTFPVTRAALSMPFLKPCTLTLLR